MHRKLTFGSVLFFLFLVVSNATWAQKEFQQTIPLQPGETVWIKTYKGTIHVSPWDRDEVSVFARITPPDDENPDYARRVVEATKVEVRQRGDGVLIRSDYDDVPARGTWFSQIRNLAFVHYEIHTPREVDVRLEDNKSEIELYDLSGRFDVETYKGKLFASGLSGDIKIETFKGRAELQSLRGSLDLETYKGEILAEALEVDGPSRVETYKGEIELAVPRNLPLRVITDKGRRGTVTSDFPVEADSARKKSRSRVVERETSQGVRLKLSTYKGSIRLTRL